jgi:hypothetical protein
LSTGTANPLFGANTTDTEKLWLPGAASFIHRRGVHGRQGGLMHERPRVKTGGGWRHKPWNR